MRKKLIACLCVSLLVVSLAGCSSTEELLTYHQASGVAAIDTRLSQADYFSEDLVTVTQEDNNGNAEELSGTGSSLLVDVTDQKLLYAEHVYDRLYPASLTKLMTALVVLQYGELSDQVTVSYAASHITEGGAKLCGFAEGDKISMEALLKSLLVYSGNDAAIAIADHISGSEEAFVQKMNEEAAKIGAVHTNFVNSNGLHNEEQYTTAYDMYLIFNELLSFDTIRSIINTDSYTAVYHDKDGTEKQKTFEATNQYLSGKSEVPEGIEILGGKTGTTSKAGSCLVLLSKDAAGMEYISVIMKSSGSEALYSQMSFLLGFIK